MLNLIKYSIPLILAYSSDMLMSTVDTVFVGKLGMVEMAAIGFSSIFVWALYNLFKGILICVGTFVSTCHGKKDLTGARVALWNGLFVAFIASCLIFAFRYILPFVLRNLNLPHDVWTCANSYIDIRLLGAVGFLSSVAFASYFRGINKPKYILYASIFSNILNIILDYLLIYTFQYGITGAAVATAISQVVSLIIYTSLYFNEIGKFSFVHEVRLISKENVRQLLVLGVPYSLKIFAEVFIYLAFTTMIGWIGSVELAATAVMNQIFVFVGACAHAIGGATQVLVGQNVGKNDMAEAKSYGLLAILLNAMVTVIFASILIIFNKYICFIFNEQPEVISSFSMIVVIGSIALCFDGVHMVAGCALAGSYDTKFQFNLIIMVGYVLFLPITYLSISVYHNSLVMSWLLLAIFMFIMATILSVRFKVRRMNVIQG